MPHDPKSHKGYVSEYGAGAPQFTTQFTCCESGFQISFASDRGIWARKTNWTISYVSSQFPGGFRDIETTISDPASVACF